jgi:thiosulfate dehydrogenase [quinone] large subunit
MNYSKSQLISLVALRFIVGWHFLYEGLTKIFTPSWTSKAYLLDSGGFASSFFVWIAKNQTLLTFNDTINAWALTLIGLFLILGCFEHLATIMGMLLLSLYYLSHPPFPGIDYMFPSDGSYFIINKTIVEIASLAVICCFPTAHIIGIKRFFNKNRRK